MKKEKTGGIIPNLWIWISKLYKESPFFVWLFVLQIPLTLGISLLGAYFPSALVDDITRNKSVTIILIDLGILGGGLAFLNLANVWVAQTQQIKGEKLRYSHSMEIIQALLRTDYAKTEKPETQQIFFKLQEMHIWSETFTKTIMEAITGIAATVCGMVVYVGILSKISPWILLLSAAGALIHFMVCARCNRWEVKNRQKWWALDIKMQYLSLTLSSYESAKDVHLYHMPPWLGRLYHGELKKRLRYTVRQQANYFLQSVSWRLIQLLTEGAAYLYLIYCACEGTISTAECVFYFGIITNFSMCCHRIVWELKTLHETALNVAQNQSFLETLKPGETPDKPPLQLPAGHIPEIRFRNVSFQYEGASKPTIRNLNLTIKPGENLAVVGLNGAGKTTFIKLLCGFYNPTQGAILIDGVDRSRYSLSSWLHYFTGVFQDMGLFSLTLGENLTPEGMTDKARLQKCLRQAGLDEKLGKLPAGLDTVFGMGIIEDAVEFSGGELQKLMLARALYKQAPLMVLDEPTAALDPLTENELYEQYRDFSEDKTTVFISHRLASTHFCDRILLMEDGAIAEMGTHRELLEKGGKYARMYQIQSKYYQQAEAGLEGEVIY